MSSSTFSEPKTSHVVAKTGYKHAISDRTGIHVFEYTFYVNHSFDTKTNGKYHTLTYSLRRIMDPAARPEPCGVRSYHDRMAVVRM